MEKETKLCPYCNEEILAVAKKCKHCGEFLDKEFSAKTSFADIAVEDKWKKRFEVVDFFVIEGKWWKYNPNFWKSSLGERWKKSCELYFSDFPSTLAATLFGGFYYLFKGMWLKFLIYGALSILTGGVLWVLFPCFAPYDYYRFKVYGKQW